MEAVLLAVTIFLAGVTVSLIGYIFRTVPKLRADLAGMVTSYNREHETTERYRKAEDQLQQEKMITRAMLRALGKLPEDDDS